jgi:hypothetical protein
MLSFGLIILIILVIILQSYRNNVKISESGLQVINKLEISRELTQLRADENRIRGLALELMLQKDQAHVSKTKTDLDDRVKSVEIRVTKIHQDLVAFPEDARIFREVEDMMTTYRNNRQLQMDMIRQKKTEDAINFSQEVQEPLYEKIRQDLLLIEKNIDLFVENVKKENTILVSSALTNLLIMGGVLVLLTLLILHWLRGMFVKIFNEIKEGVNILGTSATEILTTVTEVSTGATETATAVSETTVTIEEIRQTSLMATQKAQSVLESTHRASEAAANGKEAVQQTVEGMNRINDQMKMISDRVSKLTDQTRLIGEITTAVNDIADQSNLLAVNAAIEAARAGEQGRGFGVVAQEIRSLAEQSKKATAQVKEILNEIQKGMNLTVAATEQGSKVVDSGSLLAYKSGEMIDFLSDTVNEAAQAVIQISASSQQQMAGMDQIVPAMENIKQASEQNVIGTRQTQAAAHNLNELGHNLREVLVKYKF